MLNKINYLFKSEENFLQNIRYNKNGYYIHQKNKNKNVAVSVIVPTFNSEDTLEKTIKSIITQSIDFSNIELLIIDDCSTDTTRSMILNFADFYPNIIPVFLENNSGAPSVPRNLGIDLANGKYITFIDSDDWLAKDGIFNLYSLLEKTNDNYAVGKTIKVSDKEQTIIAPYNNWATRESISPFSIKNIFYHLAPTGRMMRRDFIQKQNIKFPHMKFAEDKQFFIDVLINCKTISTSENVIYYANRYSHNQSFTTTTTIFEKTDTNISLINYVINKNLPNEIESMILNRLYGFDCITRLFNRHHFLRSENKINYYEKFAEVLATTEKVNYDFTKYLFHDWQKVLVSLFKEERYNDVEELIRWNLLEKSKTIFIDDNLPYHKLPFKDYSKVRIDMIAYHLNSTPTKEGLLINFEVYGDYINNINHLSIINRKNELDFVKFSIKKINDNTFSSLITNNELDELKNESHSISLIYNDYEKLPIKMNVRNIIKENKKTFDYYVTIADNLGLNIK